MAISYSIMIEKKKSEISLDPFVCNPPTGGSFILHNSNQETLSLMNEGDDLNQIMKFMLDKYDIDSIFLEQYLVELIKELRFDFIIEE